MIPIKINIAGEENYTGFCDKEGNKIFLGDKVEFTSRQGSVWNGIIIYEDGVFTVSILEVEQVKNPVNWDKEYDWIKSRWWGGTVGYGEYGTWDCARKSIIDIAGMFENADQYREAQGKCEAKYGKYVHNYLSRPLPCLVVPK